MTGGVSSGRRHSNVLRDINPIGSAAYTPTSPPPGTLSETKGCYGLAVPVATDLDEKNLAMGRINGRPFVADANAPQFAIAQQWIEECGRQVKLPINFCGSLLIMRLYRLITPSSGQGPRSMKAVYEAAAAYDFAFLALGHADDEADMTRARDGERARFVTHPDTRGVDGINLLLSGVTAMQEVLNNWPYDPDGDEPSAGTHPLAAGVMEKLLQALREASFPIILDRAGLGHQPDGATTSSGLTPIQIDTMSLRRIESFTRHRAHTYFMRATELAALLAGYTSLEAGLAAALDELFGLWGSLGAATDDLQDIFVDFAAGIHSICTVMAHLCVAEDESLRPTSRRDEPEDVVRQQRELLARFFGATEAGLDRNTLVSLLNEIGLRRALIEHFESQGALFAAAIYNATVHFGLDPKLIIEIVSVVCRDPDFGVPDIYLTALRTVTDKSVLDAMNVQVGKFITAYFVDRFWPTSADA